MRNEQKRLKKDEGSSHNLADEALCLTAVASMKAQEDCLILLLLLCLVLSRTNCNKYQFHHEHSLQYGV